MYFDTWSPYDPNEADSREIQVRLREKLERLRQDMRAMLPQLRREIENPRRDNVNPACVAEHERPMDKSLVR